MFRTLTIFVKCRYIFIFKPKQLKQIVLNDVKLYFNVSERSLSYNRYDALNITNGRNSDVQDNYVYDDFLK